MRRRLARAPRASSDDGERRGDLSVRRRERARRPRRATSDATCTARRSPTTRSCSTSSGSSATRTCSSSARSARASRRSSRRTCSARRLFGRVPWIADPKGEYAPLARRARRRADPARPRRRRPTQPDRRGGRLGRAARAAPRACRRRAGPTARARGGRRAPRGAAHGRTRSCDEPTLPAWSRCSSGRPARWPTGWSRRPSALAGACATGRARTAAAVRRRPARDVRRADDARARVSRPRGRPRPVGVLRLGGARHRDDVRLRLAAGDDRGPARARRPRGTGRRAR